MKRPDRSVDLRLLRLQTWMSSAFPLGAYSYSHGLETAVHDARLTTIQDCDCWIRLLLQKGSIWNDALLASLSYKACQQTLPREYRGCCASELDLDAINDLALALCCGAERLRETTELGESFLKASNCWTETQLQSLPELRQAVAFPVILGMVSAQHAMPQQNMLASFLLATYSNLSWIAARLIPLGQTETLQHIAAVEPLCGQLASELQVATISSLGNMAWCADLASLQHEQLQGRVCIT